MKNSIHTLKNEDEIIFIKRLGDYVRYYWDNKIFFENENNSIHKYYYKHLRPDITLTHRFNAIVIVNDEYKIITYGRKLSEIFNNAIYKIIIEYNTSFPCYENSYYMKEYDINMVIDNDKIESLSNIFLKNKNNNLWDSEKNINMMYEYLKSKGLGKIPELTQHLRYLKLQRIIEEN